MTSATAAGETDSAGALRAGFHNASGTAASAATTSTLVGVCHTQSTPRTWCRPSATAIATGHVHRPSAAATMQAPAAATTGQVSGCQKRWNWPIPTASITTVFSPGTSSSRSSATLDAASGSRRR